MSDEVKCPKCSSTQLTANKKGFSGKKAVAGAVLTGGIGLLAGAIGSNKIIITCLSCGHQFKPGETNYQSSSAKPQSQPHATPIDYEKRRKTNKKIAMVFCPIFAILGVAFFLCDLTFMGMTFSFLAVFSFAMTLAKTGSDT